MTNKKGCVGSYSVSSYTRGDGVSVSSYIRTCGAAHNSSNSTSSKNEEEKTLSSVEGLKADKNVKKERSE